MAQPRTGPCEPWVTTADLCSPCDDYDFDSVVLDNAIDAASEVLYHLSGRQFAGECSQTVRPCGRSVGRGARRSWAEGALPTFDCSCSSSRECGCPRLSEITLGGYPVVEITNVRIDGALLDASRYRVDDWRYLVRLPDADGTNPGWPCCQRLDLPTTEDDTFSVTFTYGRDPPEAGRLAASALACELALLCSPEAIGKCRLPHRVVSVSRQGVGMLLADPRALIVEGSTGLWEVDLFLRTFNPEDLRRPASLVTPDRGPRVRHAGT